MWSAKQIAGAFKLTPYVGLVVGILLGVVCLVGIVADWLKARPKHITVTEAGEWLYVRADKALRAQMKRVGDGLAMPPDEYGAVMIEHAASVDVLVLFARWAEGLPLEPVKYDDVHLSTHESVFGPTKPRPRDVSIKRSDLQRALRYYAKLEKSERR